MAKLERKMEITLPLPEQKFRRFADLRSRLRCGHNGQRSGQDQQRSEEPRLRSREQDRTRSPRSDIRIPQEIGRFPTNQVTNQPFVGPGQGTEGYSKTVGALQRALIELQTKQAHWNVSGTLFHPLHIMLQEHYEGLSKYADEVAERLLAIGSSADGAQTRSCAPRAYLRSPAGSLMMPR